MSEPKTDEKVVDHVVTDVDGNEFHITEELGRGGQGVVYSTDDPNLAIKQPITKDNRLDTSRDMSELFENIRRLPLPQRVRIAVPLAILKSEPGYVMQHMEGRRPFEKYDAMDREDYAATGGTKTRLQMLASAAATLARLHASGIVYGDISLNNIYVDAEDPSSVWLIDPDNLCFELDQTEDAVYYTPGYGAPELVRGDDGPRPTTDTWSFAVLAYRLLVMIHPFIGKAVLNEDAEDSWDAPAAVPSDDASPELKAYAGLLPFVDDPNDDSNRAEKDGVPLGLYREGVLTPALVQLFKETFCEGRKSPWKRPSMLDFAVALQKAADQCVTCSACGMNHFASGETVCPWCDAKLPRYCVATSTTGWQKVLQGSTNGRYPLPERMFGPFYPASFLGGEHEAEVFASSDKVRAVRGTKAFPAGLDFKFFGGEN